MLCLNILNCIMTQLLYKLQIESLSLTFHGHDLIVDSELELNYGRLDKNPQSFCSFILSNGVTLKNRINL
jgi:hypothetical protein